MYGALSISDKIKVLCNMAHMYMLIKSCKFEKKKKKKKEKINAHSKRVSRQLYSAKDKEILTLKDMKPLSITLLKAVSGFDFLWKQIPKFNDTLASKHHIFLFGLGMKAILFHLII